VPASSSSPSSSAASSALSSSSTAVVPDARRIVVLNAHPAAASFSAGLADAYEHGAVAAGHVVRRHNLHEMAFDDDFGQASFKGARPLEPSLLAFMESLHWSQQIVLVTPMWWGGLPARAKGLFDRAFLPGTAFDPRQKTMGLPKPLLAGRGARLILTSDTPWWAFSLLYRSAVRHQVANQIFGYVGVKPTRFTHLSPVEHSTPEIRAGWLRDVGALGRRGI